MVNSRRVQFQVSQAGDFFRVVLALIFFFASSLILFYMYAFCFPLYITYCIMCLVGSYALGDELGPFPKMGPLSRPN